MSQSAQGCFTRPFFLSFFSISDIKFSNKDETKKKLCCATGQARRLFVIITERFQHTISCNGCPIIFCDACFVTLAYALDTRLFLRDTDRGEGCSRRCSRIVATNTY
jgi:hypothetical protein